MGTAARSRPLLGKYAFIVRYINAGITEARFSKATGGGMTINIGEHAEGGAQAPMKEGMTASYANITLEHGVFEGNSELYRWVLESINMLRKTPTGDGIGVASPENLRNIACDQLRRDRTKARTVMYYNAQVAGFDPGDSDNTSNDVQVETLELAYEHFTVRMY